MSLIGVDNPWPKAEKRAGLSWRDFVSQSPYDFYRRIYATTDTVFKAALTDQSETAHLRHNSPRKEYELLKLCKGIKGVPEVKEFRSLEGIDIIEMERLRAQPINQLRIGWTHFPAIIFGLFRLQLKIVARGISHNDIVPSNVLVSQAGEVYVLDFDQASRHAPIIAFIRVFTGIPLGGVKSHSAYFSFILRASMVYIMRLITRINRNFVPRPVSRLIKRLIGISGAASLPKIDKNASQAARKLLQAWRIAQKASASSPGEEIAYYDFEFEGHRFPGERRWTDRWVSLSGVTDVTSKRVLEIGCNLGLLSASLLRDKGAAAALAIDCDLEILKAAELVASAFGVSPEFRQVDLDAPEDWESKLSAFEPDIVFALNVLNWVENKDRLLEFLSRFDRVIFEGHDCLEVEIERLRRVGFKRIEPVAVTERGRDILICTK